MPQLIYHIYTGNYSITGLLGGAICSASTTLFAPRLHGARAPLSPPGRILSFGLRCAESSPHCAIEART